MAAAISSPISPPTASKSCSARPPTTCCPCPTASCSSSRRRAARPRRPLFSTTPSRPNRAWLNCPTITICSAATTSKKASSPRAWRPPRRPINSPWRPAAPTKPPNSNSESNTAAVGAFVRLTAGGRTQVDEVRAGRGYQSAEDLRLHFGLGAASAVDRLEVRWPSATTNL
jgi:hypothetical protein